MNKIGAILICLCVVGVLILVDHVMLVPRYDGAFSREHSEKIKQARALLSDRRSRQVFDASVKLYDFPDFIRTDGFNSTERLVAAGLLKPPAPAGFKQYFHPAIPIARDSVVIDAGAFGGRYDMPMRDFSRMARRGTVLAFDPDPTDLEFWVDRLKVWSPDNIEFYPIALWNKSQNMQLTILPWGGSSLVEPSYIGRKIDVRTVSIDDFLKERNLEQVDFIKIDTQGSELHILAGAQQTLRRFKPDVAVSVFYNPDDLFRLMLYLDSLDLGYKFYLESHNPQYFYMGRVLYAKAKK